MAYLFLLVLLAAIAGVIRPYWKRAKRWHFVAIAFVAFVGIGITAPKPTAEELAARKSAEGAAAVTADKTERQDAHEKIVAKAAAGVEVKPDYTKGEYGKTYARIGRATFAKLNQLEPGAAYAAAESAQCDRVLSASVSDMSKPDAAIWFVDCANENRFMVTQAEATAALHRFERQALARRPELEPGCTLNTVSLCKATPVQRAAKKREVEFISGCDMLLQQALSSPSSLDMKGTWSTEFGSDTVVYRRAFDSQNGFGAVIRSQYRCDVSAETGNISRFEVQGPLGTKRLI